MTSIPRAEEVVLVDEEGRPTGVADKVSVHGPRTPRHLAFSCYGFDAAGRVLVTRRAAGKLTFPLVWTGTCCGHPAPGEAVDDAVRRRLRDWDVFLAAATALDSVLSPWARLQAPLLDACSTPGLPRRRTA